jgi:hypothetical protein
MLPSIGQRSTGDATEPEPVRLVLSSVDWYQPVATTETLLLLCQEPGAGSGHTDCLDMPRVVVSIAATPSHHAECLSRLGLQRLSGYHQGAGQEFAKRVREVASSASVYAKVQEGVLDLWVVLPRRDRSTERAVSEVVCEVLRRYPEAALDFMLAAEGDESVAELTESDYTLLTTP